MLFVGARKSKIKSNKFVVLATLTFHEFPIIIGMSNHYCKHCGKLNFSIWLLQLTRILLVILPWQKSKTDYIEEAPSLWSSEKFLALPLWKEGEDTFATLQLDLTITDSIIESNYLK